MRLATILGPSGKYHLHLKDETNADHWLLPGQFDPGTKRDKGARVTIEHRDGGWYVVGKRRI